MSISTRNDEYKNQIEQFIELEPASSYHRTKINRLFENRVYVMNLNFDSWIGDSFIEMLTGKDDDGIDIDVENFAGKPSYYFIDLLAKLFIVRNTYSKLKILLDTFSKVHRFDYEGMVCTLLLFPSLPNYGLMMKLIPLEEIDLGFEDDLIIKIASYKNNLLFMKKAVDNSMDLNAHQSFYLRAAISKNSILITNLLLNHGATFDPKAPGFPKALSECKSSSVMRVLMTHGLDINENSHLLRSAIEKGFDGLVELYVGAGVDVSDLTQGDLVKILRNFDLSIIKLLESHGVDFSVVRDVRMGVDENDDSGLISKAKFMLEIGIPFEEIIKMVLDVNK